MSPSQRTSGISYALSILIVIFLAAIVALSLVIAARPGEAKTVTLVQTNTQTSTMTIINVHYETLPASTTALTRPGSVYTITERIYPVEVVRANLVCIVLFTFSNTTFYDFPTNLTNGYFNVTIFVTEEQSLIMSTNLTTTASSASTFGCA